MWRHTATPPSGDRIELQAIGTAIGIRRPAEQPCLVGSVKSNIGHPEAARGIAGLIKTAMALRHRLLPASLHCENPTSSVDWNGLGIAPGRTVDGLALRGRRHRTSQHLRPFRHLRAYRAG